MDRRQFGRVAAAVAALRFTPSFAQLVDRGADQLTNGEFNWNPDCSTSGPVILIVSLPDQPSDNARLRTNSSSGSVARPRRARASFSCRHIADK